MIALACSQNWTRAGYTLILLLDHVLIISPKAAASETDLTQEEELAVLKEQHALLSRLLHQQNEVSWTLLLRNKFVFCNNS